MKRFAILLPLVLCACDDSDGAARALQAYGMKPVQVGGYAFFGCGRDDVYHTKFVAVNATGQRVSGVVCSGIMKGATVRLD